MDKIGTYQLLEIIHRGPQPLYRAKAVDGRVVAVKTIPVAGLTPEMRERFMREAETCRGLSHPNLVTVFETGEADGMLYQSMDLLEGADLGKVMAEGRRFTWDEKLSIMEQVCDGLEYAHEHRLVHRDIKPANLFLENSGRVRVLDFGMVRVEESNLTKVGSSLGTLNYMAPEQIRGERCTAASDVFSAGIVFFQLATGRHPFSTKDRSLPQVVSAIVFEAAPSLIELCPDAPEGLEFILNKALEKDPVNRIKNAGELKQALAICRITMKLGVPAAAPPVAASKGAPPVATPSAAPVAAPDDPEKTRAFKRPAPAGPVMVPASAPKQAPKPQPPPPAPVQRETAAPPPPPPSQFRYCPSCTSPNPPAASVCRVCGNPLRAVEVERPASKPTPWALYIAIGIAALLAVALIAVLILK